MHSLNSEDSLKIRVDTDFADCSAWSRDFEAQAQASPYQAMAWISAWHRHCEGASRGALRIVTIEHAGTPLAVLPLVLKRSLGVPVAIPVGARHFNCQMPLWDPVRAAQLGPELQATALRRAGAAIGADVILYPNMPVSWNGQLNPFISSDAAQYSNATYRLDLHPDFPALARARRSKKSLSLLRRKRKKLEEIAGPVTLHRAGDRESCEAALQAAMAHRSARRAKSGVPNFFDRCGGEAFLRDLLQQGCTVNMSNAPMSAHYLTAGDHIVATYFGTGLNGAYSCFINSFDSAFESFSPGDLALHDVIKAACEAGLTSFDLGIGDERYKQAWCDAVPLYESTIAICARGNLYRHALRLSRDSKRAFKQNQTLWNGWRAVRRVTARTFA